MDLPPFAIVSPLASREPNRPLELAQGPAVLRHPGGTNLASGDLSLRWLPKPAVIFEGQTQEISIEMDELVLDMPGFSSATGHVTHIGIPSGQVQIRLAQSLEAGTSPFGSFMFHVVNFPYVLGAPVSRAGEDGWWLGRLDLSVPGWDVVLDASEYFAMDAHGLAKALKTSGGFAITHAGFAKRNPGRPISAKSVAELLELFTFFFSFARGSWAPACLPIGFSNSGQLSWMSSKLQEWTSGPRCRAGFRSTKAQRSRMPSEDSLRDGPTRPGRMRFD